jgi:hypothetical protein
VSTCRQAAVWKKPAAVIGQAYIGQDGDSGKKNLSRQKTSFPPLWSKYLHCILSKKKPEDRARRFSSASTMDTAAETVPAITDEEELAGEAKLIKADCCQICGEKFPLMQKLSVVSACLVWHICIASGKFQSAAHTRPHTTFSDIFHAHYPFFT